jgi:hypothetical protein
MTYIKSMDISRINSSNKIFYPLLGVCIATIFYMAFSLRAEDQLISKLEKKVEIIADINSNGFLDLKEISKVYKNLGLSPTYELKRRGFNLDTNEMQQYLKNIGVFDPKTDAYNFKDGFRR